MHAAGSQLKTCVHVLFFKGYTGNKLMRIPSNDGLKYQPDEFSPDEFPASFSNVSLYGVIVMTFSLEVIVVMISLFWYIHEFAQSKLIKTQFVCSALFLMASATPLIIVKRD